MNSGWPRSHDVEWAILFLVTVGTFELFAPSRRRRDYRKRDMDTYKPLWPKIAATVAVLAFLYPLSIGPACWVSSRIDAGGTLLGTVYYPLLWLSVRSPETIGDRMQWYVELGALDGWTWVLTDDGSIEWVGD